MSLLEQNIRKRRQVDKITSQIDLEKGKNKRYKVKTICDGKIYTKELENGHNLPGFSYLILWKGYPKEENIQKPALAIQQLKKLVTTFYKEPPEKSTAISLPINSTNPMARPTVKPKDETASTKQKRSQYTKANNISKRAKNS